MWKKVTGYHEDNDLELVRERARAARSEFQGMVHHYKDLRQEYINIKKQNEIEREELKREERMAKSFKFTKMSKKVPFLPSLHQKGQLEDGVTSIDKGVVYSDDREKLKLICPDRTLDTRLKFNLVSTQNLGQIQRAVGQEMDTYDEELKKYMTKHERGLIRPVKDKEMGVSIKVQPETMQIDGTKGVWTPNDFFPKLLNNEKPLLDRTHTPRGALRAITLERNFAPEKWLYNKKDMAEFNPNQSKRDIERSKTLKRITRRQQKQKAMRSTYMESKRSTTSGPVSPRMMTGGFT